MRGLGVVLAAVLVPRDASGGVEDLRLLARDLTEVYYIGDLHGDAGCAKEWVEATGLVSLSESSAPVWTGSATAGLVFLGDYVDKGVESREVLELVRSLVGAFPDRVGAIMGNHDLFLYLDATLDGFDPVRPMGQSVQAYPYSFFHPEEFVRSPYTAKRDDDGDVLAALLRNLLHVYERRLTRRVVVPTDEAPDLRGKASLFEVAPEFQRDEAMARKVKGRLGEWQRDYARGLRDSGLVDFLRSRPLVALVGDALVVHGGLPSSLFDGADVVALVDEVATRPWANVSRAAMRFASAVTQDRSFHGEGGCDDLDLVLALTGASRVVVGHTPGDDVRERCGGKLLAADSSLSHADCLSLLGEWMAGKASWEDDKAVLGFFESEGAVIDEKLGEVRKESVKTTIADMLAGMSASDKEAILKSL